MILMTNKIYESNTNVFVSCFGKGMLINGGAEVKSKDDKLYWAAESKSLEDAKRGIYQCWTVLDEIKADLLKLKLAGDCPETIKSNKELWEL